MTALLRLPLYGAARAQPSPGTSSVPWFHLIPGEHPLVLLIQGSQLFEVDAELAAGLSVADDPATDTLRSLVALGPRKSSGPVPVSALSLNVAQSCNLACDYCYADEGRFAGAPRQMEQTVALAAIDRLFAEARSPRVTLGFIGGEPLVNRALVHRCVEHAARRARQTGIGVGFSITTNGTLVRPEDISMFREHEFTVTVSIDGDAAVHDRHRSRRGGGSSHDRVISALEPLLASAGRARVVARATVTRDDLRVSERVEALLGLGFAEAGVSPTRTGPRPELWLQSHDWWPFFESMKLAAEIDLNRVRSGAGERLRFSNLANALDSIHRGSARSLPCGAGRSYVSLGADGGYFTCHRTIDQRTFALGDVASGIDADKRASFLAARDVDGQEPCRTCWARYLCGGGCHAEVATAGRQGCDYIRAWLEFCLKTYDALLRERPELFWQPGGVS